MQGRLLLVAQGDFRRLVEELAGEALGDHLRNVRSYSELRRAVSAGDFTDRDVSEAYSEYARVNGPEYRRAASDLTMRYYQELSELSARYSDEFYAEMLNGNAMAYTEHRNGSSNGSSAPAASPSAADPADAERIPIELHGRIGHEVAARFTIENTDPSPRTITFQFAPCRAPHGEVFNAPVTVQPGSLELEPGASAAVVLRVAFMPSVFLPGLIYHQEVAVVGAKPLVLDVTLWVEVEDHADPTMDTVSPPAAAREPTEAPSVEQAPLRKAAAKKTAATKTAAKKTAAKKTSARKAPVQTTAAKKAPAKTTAAKKTAAKKALAKKAPAKKTPAKKAPAKKAAAKKAPAKKAPAKKAATKRAATKRAATNRRTNDAG